MSSGPCQLWDADKSKGLSSLPCHGPRREPEAAAKPWDGRRRRKGEGPARVAWKCPKRCHSDGTLAKASKGTGGRLSASSGAWLLHPPAHCHPELHKQ